jgi:hypothetical protein
LAFFDWNLQFTMAFATHRWHWLDWWVGLLFSYNVSFFSPIFALPQSTRHCLSFPSIRNHFINLLNKAFIFCKLTSASFSNALHPVFVNRGCIRPVGGQMNSSYLTGAFTLLLGGW